MYKSISLDIYIRISAVSASKYMRNQYLHNDVFYLFDGYISLYLESWLASDLPKATIKHNILSHILERY
jgi:hypothetical protein